MYIPPEFLKPPTNKYEKMRLAILNQKELIQCDLDCLLDGLEDYVVDGACDIVIDRMNILLNELEALNTEP